jgi:cell division protein FtsW (lipid II flippase)
MLAWIASHWGWLAVMVVLAAYCGFYVLAMREQRAAADGKPKLPCDRC